MTAFQYHPDILSQFPAVVGGFLVAHNMINGPSPDNLKQIYFQEQQSVLARIGEKPLSEIETLAAWRSAFRSFGVNQPGTGVQLRLCSGG